jgi:succinate dehydrogenase/fumarate reductase flavoprotein subunit
MERINIGNTVIVTTNVLVIGGGVAGMRAAIAADQFGCEVILVAKRNPWIRWRNTNSSRSLCRVWARQSSRLTNGTFTRHSNWLSLS